MLRVRSVRDEQGEQVAGKIQRGGITDRCRRLNCLGVRTTCYVPVLSRIDKVLLDFVTFLQPSMLLFALTYLLPIYFAFSNRMLKSNSCTLAIFLQRYQQKLRWTWNQSI